VARDRPVPRRDCFGTRRFDPYLAVERPERIGRRYLTHMVNPFTFLQDVRAEAAKVTWPSRRETLITTGLVIAMVLAASLFFVAVDQGLRLIVGFVLNIGHS
jgi:preprotein translocase subunit SecE